MSCRRTNLCALLCLASWLSVPAVVVAAREAAKADTRPALEITKDTLLDPAKSYGPIVIKASNITLDGRGAWVIGATRGEAKDYKGVGVWARGVSNVTLKNLNAKGWDIGLKVEHGRHWLVENCNFSDNFHYPEAGWGELGRHGGIVFEFVDHSTLRKNKANRVWDACMLANSDDNLAEENDFSHTSNTCLSLWTACRNRILKNNLSWGIRIKPGEVHARDSACVMVQAGADDNYFADNDITHGGDGVFIRPYAGCTSSGNVFERNDASFANNNCIEAQCPRNTYRRNKANHGSHGIWVGWSNETIVEDNEACYNGLPSGLHNAPWGFKYVPKGPQPGAAGIIMAGMCNHTLCRGNKCIGNNGVGISLFGDASPEHKFTAFHWVLENNVVRDNRWGIYMEFADWIDMAGNILENNRDGDIIRGGSNTNIFIHPDDPQITMPPRVKLAAPTAAKAGQPVPVKLGQEVLFDASLSTDPGGRGLSFRWDFTDGTTAAGPRVTHAFGKIGLHSIGMTASNGRFSNLEYRDFLVYEDVAELGTEGQAAQWSWGEVQPRDGLHVERNRVTAVGPAVPVANPQTKLEFSDDRQVRLVGNSSLALRVEPSGNPISILYPRAKNAGIPLAGKTQLVFWAKMLNTNIHAWKGLMPTLTLYESPTRFCELRPYDDQKNWQGGVDWIYKSVPLHGNQVWKLKGEVPATLNWVTIEFYPWGGAPFHAWIDGMAIK
ncbi:MAG: right-handed parallel beta-helix repeat-containing protein [Thermoguttaceae bacterium]|jgi:parallel beta-helix repeat protein